MAEPEEPERKRRRVGLAEVAQELRSAGLQQPALAFIQEVDKRRRLEEPSPAEPLRLLKRGQELQHEAMKRRRITDQVPVLKCVPEDVSTSLVPCRATSSKNLVSTNPCVQLLLSGAAGLRQLTIDSQGIVFEVYDHGFMLTELPRGWQPIVNSSGRLARVAKVALDPNGTAYFLSDTGELLMMVSAVRYLERPGCQEELKLEFVDKKHIPFHARADLDEHFSPSTFAPSPSVQDSDDEDDAMEWEDL
ncbi:unnamed protein product [Effrenium voratum]|nr:unnamed protein product [Effrenium voratum]|mmetsp:Transcript_40077/g.95739  ORF Transcript_40077/g.95739 Transcript_40077/m.95739 type:complete len:248 (-) Transcript_40077:90-833(-)